MASNWIVVTVVAGAVAELAAYFQISTLMPGTDLARLTRAARTARATWAAIAAACGVATDQDTCGGGVRPGPEDSGTGAGLLFEAT